MPHQPKPLAPTRRSAIEELVRSRVENLADAGAILAAVIELERGLRDIADEKVPGRERERAASALVAARATAGESLRPAA